jgi:DNA repair photolyase
VLSANSWLPKFLLMCGVTDPYQPVERHFPDRKDKVLNRLRDIRGGVLYDSRWGARMRGDGPFTEQVRQVFDVSCRKFGLNEVSVELSTAGFRRPARGGQLGLFDAS